MRVVLRALMVAGVVMFAACSTEGEPQQQAISEPIAQSGEQNFIQYCAACHGEGGKGDGPVASSLEGGAPDLTQIAAQNNGEFPWKEVRSKIDGRWEVDAHGTQAMPVWGYEFWMDPDGGNFDEQGVLKILDGLVDYIQSIQQ